MCHISFEGVPAQYHPIYLTTQSILSYYRPYLSKKDDIGPEHRHRHHYMTLHRVTMGQISPNNSTDSNKLWIFIHVRVQVVSPMGNIWIRHWAIYPHYMNPTFQNEAWSSLDQLNGWCGTSSTLPLLPLAFEYLPLT